MSSPSLTASAAPTKTTNAIPNLKGGANPATPKLAGIICGASILLAWTVCLIYWWWNRRREKQDAVEALRMKELQANETASPRPRRSSRAAASGPMRRYPPNTTVLPGAERATSPEGIRSGEGRRSFEMRRPDHVGASAHPGTLTPMAEVPSRLENGEMGLGPNGLAKR